MRSKLFALIFVFIFAAAFCGCRGNYVAPDPVSPGSTADPDSSHSHTIHLQTPDVDPDLYELGENGYYEDEYMSVNFPSFLSLEKFTVSGGPIYTGEYDGHKYKMSYLRDVTSDYETVLSGATAESYGEYLNEQVSKYYVMQELSHIKIDGHDATLIRYYFQYPNDPDKRVPALQYCINVDGWIMSLGFTTDAEDFTEECYSFTDTIHFKPGY